MAEKKAPWRSNGHRASEEHWVPLSDLMTGLMMIFLLISVIFMVQVDASRDAMRSVAQQYNETRDDLYKDLLKEFSPDLARWRATLDHDLTIRFQEPNVLFDTGKADLKIEFKGILGDFSSLR